MTNFQFELNLLFRIVDVESGVSRTILQPNKDFATNCLGVVSVRYAIENNSFSGNSLQP